MRSDLVAPVGLAIEAAGIDAGIEALRVVDGAMQDPSGPWVVAWYENLGSLGKIGNVVMAGHIDYWNVGPAVFYNLSTLEPGDEIVVTGDDGKTYPFAVEWVRQYDSASIPLDEVAGPTDGAEPDPDHLRRSVRLRQRSLPAANRGPRQPHWRRASRCRLSPGRASPRSGAPSGGS